jgi:4-hydroxythreonine-4-phosphate dehydrogenase
VSTIGISAGDPAGIGLEVVFKALPSLLPSARWVLFCDPPAFETHYQICGGVVPHRWISNWDQISSEAVLFLMNVSGGAADIPLGKTSHAAGRRAVAYLTAASDAALAGHIDAIVTAPVNKASIGSPFVGQTEILAERAHSREFAMAFFAPTFKVVLATVHAPLQEAIRRISTAGYIQLIELVWREFARFGFEKPRIAVAAINPHAGENGMFGREDIDVLEPAVRHCAAAGVSVSGPHSADSLYYRAHAGEFDVVIAPYHDQGLIPVKLIAHGSSTNVTLGLPYVRTSPDHGTAFAIAGKGIADASGMGAAMRCALDLVERSGKRDQTGPQSEQTP